ncbi:unnamed protein product [Cladocopium goreaui]|uniref:Gastricsin n=1 Tax=Cladocopium goreaui TaxID=2562237 RepID=A0A9P1CTW6_9DINO|nr:unnamed protein product [Cladocopium goreaui]
MMRLICTVYLAVSDDLTVPLEEACDAGDQECALSFRQLRGQQAEVAVSRHRSFPFGDEEDDEEIDEGDEDVEEEISKVNETALQDKRESEEGGTCCYSGENSKDLCGTCYPMSMAPYTSKCSKKDNCMGCGGTWCQSKCVIGAADPFRKCQTAYPTGVSKDPACSKDKAGCTGCNGEWCRAGYNSHFVMGENSHGREVPEYVAGEEFDGICCYRGEEKNDTRHLRGHRQRHDLLSQEPLQWLRWHLVKAFKDPEDPCKSAEPITGIAERWDFCALNEKHCSNCKGARYKPGVKYEPISDQRLTAENHTATQEAEEEVANDDSLDDLFPDGLADTAIHDLPVDPAQSTAPLGPESPGEDEDSEDSQELPVA